MATGETAVHCAVCAPACWHHSTRLAAITGHHHCDLLSRQTLNNNASARHTSALHHPRCGALLAAFTAFFRSERQVSRSTARSAAWGAP